MHSRILTTLFQRALKSWNGGVFSSAHISLTFAMVGLCSLKGRQCVYHTGRKPVRCGTETQWRKWDSHSRMCLFIAISKIHTVIPSKLMSQCYCLWINIPIWLSHQCQQQHREKPFISISVQRDNFYYPTALSVLIYSLTKWSTTDFLSCSVPTHPQSVMQNVLHSIDLPAFHGFCF